MNQPQPLALTDQLLLVAGGIVAYAALSWIGPGLDGPQYLGYYAVVWLVLWLLQYFFRLARGDGYSASGAAALVYLAVAYTRYSWGAQNGLHRWAFLAIMAAVGSLLFLVRARDLNNAGGGASSCSSSCGGGGCGGGCGGGGCGGCGG